MTQTATKILQQVIGTKTSLPSPYFCTSACKREWNAVHELIPLGIFDVERTDFQGTPAITLRQIERKN